MKNIIIGTAGHVDHGKTQLIKALSGIDTDRLSEEKKRGITIELGFAHIPNDAGYNIGVIDVPGHEKFIKNMLAGIGGIDFVLFVVAADEGIMPQTKEHFEILQSLGIDDGIIAVTKKDMVDDEWMEMLLEDVKDYFKGSFLEGKPIITVSSKTGDNIDKLRDAIIAKCDRDTRRIEEKELFRLPIDRVFSMQGFGTVVTGTLIDGTCSVNDEVCVFPTGSKVKIRGIQTYGKDVDSAIAGQRTAVNLSGIKKEDVDRGDVLASEHAVSVTNMIDVSMRVFSSSDRIVLNNSRVHLYTGSTEVLCKVVLMDRDALSAGETAYAQLRLEEPVALRRGDRFIIRFYSPMITVGGGRILDACPDKHKRNREDILSALVVLDNGSIEDIMQMKVNGRRVFKADELAWELGLLRDRSDKIVSGMIDSGKMIKLDDGSLIGADKMDVLTGGLTSMLDLYHEENPLAEGMPKQETLSRLKDVWHFESDKLVSALASYMLKTGVITDLGKSIARTGFKAEFTEEQTALKDRIKDIYEKAGIEMVKNDSVYEMDSDRKVINAILQELASEGVIVKVDPSYYVTADGWKRVVEAAAKLGKKGSFTLAEYRDELDTSRKYASAFLQSLDRAGITSFNGEARTCRI